MKMSVRALIPLVLFAGVLIAFFVGTRLNPNELDSPLIGKTLPAFELESVYDDQPPVNSEQFRGKVTLINAFGSWCPTCLVEHPFLMELGQRDDILLVGLDWNERSKTDALNWLARHGDPYDLIAFDVQNLVTIDLGIYKSPETLLVDPQGVVLLKHDGALNEDIWQKKFVPLIKQMETGQ